MAEPRGWIQSFIGSVTVEPLAGGGFRVDFDVSADEAAVDLGENSDDPPTDDEQAAVEAAVEAVFADPIWKGNVGSRAVIVTAQQVAAQQEDEVA